jgi:SAM-dependent methyltransferase
MVDRAYSDEDLASWYDVLNQWGADNDFYLDLVRSANAVLDVGCGTGVLLHRARDAGHTGRLCGLDPSAGMLAHARERADVDWVLGDLASVDWDQEFDLAVMTGHAFQVLLSDDELRTSLAAVRAALTEGGRFAFETRNPLVRPWERWTPEHGREVTNAAGATVRVEHEVQAVEGDVVRMAETFIGAGGREVSTGSLRFLDADRLAEFLDDAGLVVEEQFGDWDRSPLTATSREIITIARR